MHRLTPILAMNAFFTLSLIVSLYAFMEFRAPDETIFDTMTAVSPLWAIFIALYLPAREQLKQRQIERANLQQITYGLINELSTNKAIVDTIRMELSGVNRNLETDHIDMAVFDTEFRNFCERNGPFKITRPIYERLGNQISQLPEAPIKAIITFQSDLDRLESRVQKDFELFKISKNRTISKLGKFDTSLTRLSRELSFYRDGILGQYE